MTTPKQRLCLHCGKPLPKQSHRLRKYHPECFTVRNRNASRNYYYSHKEHLMPGRPCRHCREPLFTKTTDIHQQCRRHLKFEIIQNGRATMSEDTLRFIDGYIDLSRQRRTEKMKVCIERRRLLLAVAEQFISEAGLSIEQFLKANHAP